MCDFLVCRELMDGILISDFIVVQCCCCMNCLFVSLLR